MIHHPIRASTPTTQMILSSCIARDIASREPAPENALISHSVFCTNPDAQPGQRNWIVVFNYEDGSANQFDGRNWKHFA